MKSKLQKMVKMIGWKNTSNAVSGGRKLAELAFDNDPFEFLNSFNNLEVVQSEERPNSVLFRYEKGNNMMVYDRKNKYVYINYYDIWSFLEEGFGLNYAEIQELTQGWLGEAYNLRGTTTCARCLGRSDGVG